MDDIYYESTPMLSTMTFMEDCHVLVADSEKNDSTLHWHHAFELVFVVKGCVHSICDGVSFDTRAGECHIINSQSIHSGINPFPNQPVRALIVQISDSYLQKILPAQPLAAFSLVRATAPYNRIRECCAEIYSCILKQDEYSCLQIISKLNAILYTLFSHCQTGTIRSTRYAKDVIQYVCTHFTEDIALEDAAAYVGLQKNYFCRKFKEETGLSFKNYLNRVRLDTALSLLAEGGISAMECALQSGFTSEKVLIDWCRKIYNTTPTSLIKQRKTRD